MFEELLKKKIPLSLHLTHQEINLINIIVDNGPACSDVICEKIGIPRCRLSMLKLTINQKFERAKMKIRIVCSRQFEISAAHKAPYVYEIKETV
jgi:hypothetical protein